MSYKGLALGAAALFGGTSWFSYRYARPHALIREQPDGEQGGGAPDCAFDRLADRYDDAVGQEEAVMWYGMMRSWLVAQAEVSAC